MSGFQPNDFNEAGILGREAKQEWQPYLVAANFNVSPCAISTHPYSAARADLISPTILSIYVFIPPDFTGKLEPDVGTESIL